MRKYWWIALASFLADQGTKLLARRLTEPVALIPGIIGLRYAENTGMAFSLLSGKPWLLGLLSLVIIAAAFFLLRGRKLHPVIGAGLMMMLGGAAGNLVDRFAMGYVPDMIELQFVRFAIFNLADAFLVIGCGLVILSLFRAEKHG